MVFHQREVGIYKRKDFKRKSKKTRFRPRKKVRFKNKRKKTGFRLGKSKNEEINTILTKKKVSKHNLGHANDQEKMF